MTRRIGIVLSTGDLRGVFAHTGFLLALEDLGVEYQAMAGSSAGAIVAGIVASGKPVAEFADWLKRLRVRDYWGRDSVATILYHVIVKRGRGYTGLISTDRLERTIAGLLVAKTFECCPVPLYLVATNLTKATREVFDSGEIAPRAVASAAIPALLKAKRIGDSVYVDGGVFDFTPRSAICCREKLDLLIVNEVRTSLDRSKGDNRFLEERWSLVQVIVRVLDALYEKETTRAESSVAACRCGCSARIITIAPSVAEMDRLRPEQGVAVMAQARREAHRLLPPLLKQAGVTEIDSSGDGTSVSIGPLTGGGAMEKDPVCGMQVDEKKAAKSGHQGKTFYFCSPSCKTTFDKSPDQFAKRA